MKFATGLLVSAAAAAAPVELFAEFEAKFAKKYETADERAERLAIFEANLERFAALQAVDAGASYGHLSPLADWTQAEFTARNTLQPRPDAASAARAGAPALATEALPTDFDWRSKGAVGPVKNQEQCGSCWAFSAVGAIEGVNAIATGSYVALSEQELIDCDASCSGCQGGRPDMAFTWMQQSGTGLETEAEYPYKAKNDQCHHPYEAKVFISGMKEVDGSDEAQLAAALVKYGPLAIGINANHMQAYTGGIADPADCPPQLDHGVVLVGFGVDDGKKYWTIRNSWGEEWGEEGYYRIVSGKSACGLNTNVHAALAAKEGGTIVV